MTVIKALCGRALVVVDGRPVVVDEPERVFKHEGGDLGLSQAEDD